MPNKLLSAQQVIHEKLNMLQTSHQIFCIFILAQFGIVYTTKKYMSTLSYMKCFNCFLLKDVLAEMHK